MIFDRYSRYYDLLYRDKDYPAEAAFVDRLIQGQAKGARAILELGCGTGLHAAMLAEIGYRVTGVDQSEEMLKRAEERKSSMPQAQSERLSFRRGDARTVRTGSRFDCVASLFHVVSYQSTNADLHALFATARAHLDPGGVFVFDCWYGPAVLEQRPAVRVKRLEGEGLRVTRIAEPTLHPNECLVDVDYLVFVEDPAAGTVERLTESHRMRYLFRPEIEALLAENGMRLAHGCEWLTGGPLGEDTWGACFVARVESRDGGGARV